MRAEKEEAGSELAQLMSKAGGYIPSKECQIIEKAFSLSQNAHNNQFRKSGEPFIAHPLEVAHILADLHLDAPSLATALLHDVVEDTSITLEEIEKQFGKTVSFLVDGVTKLSQISFKSNYEKESENIRKMFVAMGKDVRVILVKLADRLHNMRTLKPLSDARKLRISKETLNIYAPLAGRLGLNSIKIELEDLAFKYIYPEVYSSIFKKFEDEGSQRDQYIQDVISFLKKDLRRKTSIPFEIKGRTKNIYSIYKKMQIQKVDYDQIYDIIAFRICVKKLHECYELLGWVHSLWKPIPGRFKDFIAIPKANGYQSLHTTVIGPEGKKIEIQIRTDQMHQVAEKGVASHWQYKEKSFSKNGSSKKLSKVSEAEFQKISWLQDLVLLHRQAKHSNEFLESVKAGLFESDIYVFTPKGDVKEFSSGASAIDFAYAVHTDVGNKLKSAQVNGRIVPLKYQLQNGDVIEVFTSEKSRPKREWLNFCITSKARSRIRSCIKEEERQMSVTMGKRLLEKELKNFDMSIERFLNSSECKKTMVSLGLNNEEDIYAQIGYGKLVSKNFIQKAFGEEEAPLSIKKKASSNAGSLPVEVEGMEDVVVHIARCCSPLPGEDILGYISLERGIVIHHRECSKLNSLDSERYVDVSWRKIFQSKHQATLTILTHDKPGVLNDISNVFSERGFNILEIKGQARDDFKASVLVRLEVKDIQELRSVIQALERLKYVFNVSRR